MDSNAPLPWPALYDALLYLGRGLRTESWQCSDLDSLRRTLDRYGIEKAWLGSFADRTSVELDRLNERLFKVAREDERLLPSPAVLSNAGLETGDEKEYIGGLMEQGASCVCLYPQTHGLGLDPRVSGALFKALEERRLPVALFETDVLDAASLAARHPKLPLIVHTPSYRNRHLLPALKDAPAPAPAPNLYLSIKPNFAAYRGLEVLCQTVGAERILFASGYPLHEPGAPLTYLAYANISDEEREKIACGNMRKLLAGVRPSGEAPVSQTVPAIGKARGERASGLCGAVWKKKPVELPGIVDMHAHYGRTCKFPIWGGAADDLVAEMDRAGVEKIFVSHQACMSPDVAWGNGEVLEAVRKYPERILGYAACYPVNEELGIREIERSGAAGLHGIKMHSSSGIPYTHEGYRPVWAYADERRLPVLLHTWGDIEELESIFERHRNAPILLGHAGSARPELYVEYARKYPNLYLELCFSRAPYGLVEYFVSEVGAERVLFGSDAPWMAVGQQLGRVLFAGISDERKKTILVENPKRILDGIKR